MNIRSETILVMLAASLVVAAGCGRKSGDSEPVVILTNSLQVSANALPVQAEVKIAGVTRAEEVSLIDLLHVTGLLTRGTQQVAIINGNVVSMGEEMELDANERHYKLKVLSITDESIKLIAEQQ